MYLQSRYFLVMYLNLEGEKLAIELAVFWAINFRIEMGAVSRIFEPTLQILKIIFVFEILKKYYHDFLILSFVSDFPKYVKENLALI